DAIDAERVEHVAGLARRARESAERAARRERADVDAGVERDLLHADPVAEQRAASERRGGIDADDADGEPGVAIPPRETGRQRALARTGRTGEPDAARSPDERMQIREQRVESGAMVLHDAD